MHGLCHPECLCALCAVLSHETLMKCCDRVRNRQIGTRTVCSRAALWQVVQYTCILAWLFKVCYLKLAKFNSVRFSCPSHIVTTLLSWQWNTCVPQAPCIHKALRLELSKYDTDATHHCTPGNTTCAIMPAEYTAPVQHLEDAYSGHRSFSPKFFALQPVPLQSLAWQTPNATMADPLSANANPVMVSSCKHNGINFCLWPANAAGETAVHVRVAWRLHIIQKESD